MKCKHLRAPENAIFCPDCGKRLVEQHDVIRVPVPKRKGNQWCAQVTVDGERVYVSADSEDEYYAKARAAKSGLIEIKKAALKPTLGAVIDSYIKANTNTLSPSTIRGYRAYRKYRFAQYMSKRIDDIDYQRMINEECLLKVKPKTIHNAWRLCTAALAYIGEPSPKVNLPKKPKTERPWLDFEQIQTLLRAVEDQPCELLVILALHGLRRSEILHLSSADIDTKKNIIHIRGASVFDSTNHLVDKPTNKNTTSTRDVHIVIPRLTELIEDKKDRLITDHPNTLWGQINRICESAGLPKVGIHGLRHSYISLCFHLGWDVQTVMHQGGYADIQTVNEVYRHLAQKDANADIQKMRDFFSQSVGRV